MSERSIRPGQERPGSRRTPLIVTDFVPLAKPGRPTTKVHKMALPYKCMACGEVYDGGRVEVTGRYADCDRWQAPCCGATHDTRTRWGGPSWDKMGYVDLRERARLLALQREGRR